MILVDGIPLTSHDQLLDLPADRIRSVQLKNKLYIHGNHIFSGIVNFVSRNGDFAGLELSANSLLSSIDLPDKGEIAPIPAVMNYSDPFPVLDNTLFWTDSLKSSAGSLKFSTNDITGDFIIYVYGFDSNGNWHHGTGRFQVLFPTMRTKD